jgi:hypothetical protein
MGFGRSALINPVNCFTIPKVPHLNALLRDNQLPDKAVPRLRERRKFAQIRDGRNVFSFTAHFVTT